MAGILAQLNNRELSLLLWGGLFFGWALTISKARKSLGPLFQSLLHPKVGIPLLVVILYTLGIVTGLNWIGFWKTDLLKDTILWFLLAGLSLVFEAATSKHAEPLLRRVLRDALGVVILFEFVADAYTLPLSWELLLIPVVSIIAIMDAYAGTQEKYSAVKRLTGVLLAAFGFLILGSAIVQMVQDFAQISSPDALRAILLPLIMSISFIPVALGVGAFATYENLFLRMSFGPKKERDVVRYAKYRFVVRFRLDLGRANRFLGRNALGLMHLKTKRDVENLLLTESVQHAADSRAHVGSWLAPAEVEESQEG